MSRRADVAVAERLRAREEGALREVMDIHGGAVYGMARRVVADPNLAEEVAQDTFLALWRRPDAFDAARGTLRSFLVGVARNKAVDLVRREESLRRRREALSAEMETASKSDTADEQLIAIEDSQEVRGALAQLSQVQREAVVLAYFGGRTYREVADELGLPEGTAKTRLRDGLLRLKRLLATAEEG